MLRYLPIALALATAPAAAQEVKRNGTPASPILTSAEVAAGARTVYVSGLTPDVADPAAAEGSPARFGDTETQARSVFKKIQAALATHGLDMGDVVMMHVYLVAPPGQPRMDFQGMMKAYLEYFGTAAQPNKTARTTIQVPALAGPDFLVEIEAIAVAK